MIKTKYYLLAITLLFSISFGVKAEVKAYELIYEEQETGIDPYLVKFIITDRYIRIDDLADQSGYVLYDRKNNIIHSVAHHDESILLIKKYNYQVPDFTKIIHLEYTAMPDVPKISGKNIYHYQVTSLDEPKEKCLDIMLAEGFLPEVTQMLTSYQKMMAGQQSLLLKTTPKEYQGSCFLYDQIFNEGDYYQKGLPIQEWHSNGRSRLLTSFNKVKVDSTLFKLEKNYRTYSLE